MQTNSESHSMISIQIHPSGAEEWFCPQCGRKFVVQWSPNFKRIVLTEGDAQAIHATNKGGLRMGPSRIANVAGDLKEAEPEQMDVWLDHLNEIDFDL